MPSFKCYSHIELDFHGLCSILGYSFKPKNASKLDQPKLFNYFEAVRGRTEHKLGHFLTYYERDLHSNSLETKFQSENYVHTTKLILLKILVRLSDTFYKTLCTKLATFQLRNYKKKFVIFLNLFLKKTLRTRFGHCPTFKFTKIGTL